MGTVTGLSTTNSTVVSAFHHTLGVGLIVILGIVAVAIIALTVLERRFGASTSGGDSLVNEPRPRRFLRIGFGLLWLLDGLLQLKAQMPLGLIKGVVLPSATGSPSWVVHLVHSSASVWSNHPVPAAAAVVWIQAGLGLWLLITPSGWLSRIGGGASALWALIVWACAESFGAIFSSHSGYLLGTPGAALWYAIAGMLLALPFSAWDGKRLGQFVIYGAGIFFSVMTVLQALPGNGFWHVTGRGAAASNNLVGTVPMGLTNPQPGFLHSWIQSFANFSTDNPVAVNIVCVVALGVIAIAFLIARPLTIRIGVGVATVFSLAIWFLVEDFGFLGGLGTDPNSMLPGLGLIVTGAYGVLANQQLFFRPFLPRLSQALKSFTPFGRRIASLSAIAVVAVGALPMAIASATSSAQPLLAQALNGTPQQVNVAASPFSLTNQHGQPVSLKGLHGHLVVLAFLDPLCTTDCPILARELRSVDLSLGKEEGTITFVAVCANPVFSTVASLNRFDHAKGLTTLPNWQFATGPLSTLKKVWSDYDVTVTLQSGGAMVNHSDIVFLIDKTGHLRTIINADPGTTASIESSFQTTLTNSIKALS